MLYFNTNVGATLMRLMSDVLAVSKTLPQVQFIVKRYLMDFRESLP